MADSNTRVIEPQERLEQEMLNLLGISGFGLVEIKNNAIMYYKNC